MPKVSGLSLRYTSLECYTATPKSWYISSKKIGALHKTQGYFTFHTFTILWTSKFHEPIWVSVLLSVCPIFQQYHGRRRLQQSSSNHNGCFSGNFTASCSKIMQNHFDFYSEFPGDHTRMSGTFKSDFFSRCCFFVYVLSAIQIAPIINCFPFKFITLVVVRGLFISCWYPTFVGIKPNLLFHILRRNLPLFLFLFLLHRCV